MPAVHCTCTSARTPTPSWSSGAGPARSRRSFRPQAPCCSATATSQREPRRLIHGGVCGEDLRTRPEEMTMAACSRHGVVVGASMAGLMAARVLANHFEAVTVVERDVLPEGPVSRKGVPQGRHAHALLAAGEKVLVEMFPGIVEELVAGGAQRLDFAPHARW